MSNPTARAIATVAVSAGCGAVAFTEPLYGMMSLVAIVVSTYIIWSKA